MKGQQGNLRMKIEQGGRREGEQKQPMRKQLGGMRWVGEATVDGNVSMAMCGGGDGKMCSAWSLSPAQLTSGGPRNAGV